MNLETFLLEREQSLYEHEVELNLAESGVEPLHLHELVPTEEDRAALLDQQLLYTQTNGTRELRRAIAEHHDGATEDNLLVTNGCSEANLLVALHLAEPGTEVVAMVPNYLQTWGLTRGLGCQVHPWPLVADEEASRWRPDLEALEELLTPRTRLLWICNPNNPTGATFTAEELDGIAALADRHGTWILSDEVYRGAELDGEETPSMWGRSARAVVTAGLSKAFGLPGLRVGWALGPPETVAELWATKDYTSIAPGALSDHLACGALARRSVLLERTRSMLRENYAVTREWLVSYGDFFSHIPPRAGAMLFARYHHSIGSTELADRLRKEKSVLVVPGDHYGMDGYLRLGYGAHPDVLTEALRRMTSVLQEL